METVKTWLDLLQIADPTLRIVFVGLAALILFMANVGKGWLGLRERGLRFTHERQKLLLQLIEKASLSTVSSVHLEIAFSRCMGFSLPSDLLRFALARENALRLLNALRRGRHLVIKQADGSFHPKGPASLGLLTMLAYACIYAGFLGAIGFAVAAEVRSRPGLYMIAIEFVTMAWVGGSGIVAGAAAKFLTCNDNFPPSPLTGLGKSSRPKRKRRVAEDAELVLVRDTRTNPAAKPEDAPGAAGV